MYNARMAGSVSQEPKFSANDPVQPWEYAFDILLWLGALYLLWFVLFIYGYAPEPPHFLKRPLDPVGLAQYRTNALVFFLLGTTQYVYLLVLFNDRFRAKRNDEPWTVIKRVWVRVASAAFVWVLAAILQLRIAGVLDVFG